MSIKLNLYYIRHSTMIVMYSSLCYLLASGYRWVISAASETIKATLTLLVSLSCVHFMFEIGSRMKFPQESDSAKQFLKKVPKVVKIQDGRKNTQKWSYIPK